MLWMKQFFAAPVFEDEDKTRAARLLDGILHVLLGVVIAASIIMTVLDPASFWGDWSDPVILGSATAVILVLRFLMRRGYVRPIGVLLSLALLALVILSAHNFGGITDPVIIYCLLCVALAGLLVGGRAALVFTGLGVLAVAEVWFAERTGLITYHPPLTSEYKSFAFMSYSLSIIITGLLLRYAANHVTQSLERAHHNERAQMEANRELQKLQASLEQQVLNRTRDLERRSRYLEAAARVGHAASSILEANSLIQQIVELIHEWFEFYHVALFTLDETSQWLVFRASNGQVGRLIQAQGLRVKLGGGSMVGRCAADVQARVAQDVRLETERVGHPLLPDTRSEIALPLIARGQVIGALDAQSSRLNDFDQDTVAVLQAVADQVAVALDNARLFTETQAALEAEHRAYGQISHEAWARRLRESRVPGYRYVGRQIMPVGDAQPPEMESALQEGRSIVASALDAEPAAPAFATPIKVRDQTIGVVGARKSAEGGPWTPEEIALMETLADQLGVALDSARLFEEAQRRAARERLVGQITARIRSSATLDGVLNSAIQEISQMTGAGSAAIDLDVTAPERR